MAAAAPLGCDFVPSLRCAMDSAWVYFGLFSGNFDGIRLCMVGLRTSHRIVPTSVGTWILLHAGLRPLLLEHGFQQTSCSTATSVTSVFFRNFVFEMAPKAALLGLHSSALPAPSTPEEAEVARDFRNFVEQHQFYVPNINFAREEHPPRVQTRSLPAPTWVELRYSSSHFEAILRFASARLCATSEGGGLFEGPLLRRRGRETSRQRPGAPQLVALRRHVLLQCG